MSAPLTVLLVEPDNDTRALTAKALQDAGVSVIEAYDFHTAKHTLDATPADVLVAEIRLGAYNGLHLLLRAKNARPGLIGIVTARSADPVLEREAAQLDATFLVKDGGGDWIVLLAGMLKASFPAGSAGV